MHVERLTIKQYIANFLIAVIQKRSARKKKNTDQLYINSCNSLECRINFGATFTEQTTLKFFEKRFSCWNSIKLWHFEYLIDIIISKQKEKSLSPNVPIWYLSYFVYTVPNAINNLFNTSTFTWKRHIFVQNKKLSKPSWRLCKI